MSQENLRVAVPAKEGTAKGSEYPGAFGDFSTYHPGTLAECIQALLLLEDELTKISAMYNEQQINQLKASRDTAEALAVIDKQLGWDDFGQQISQAGGQIIGGAISVVGGMDKFNPLYNADETGIRNECMQNIEAADKYHDVAQARLQTPGSGTISDMPAEAYEQRVTEFCNRDFAEKPLKNQVGEPDEEVTKALNTKEAAELNKKVDEYTTRQENTKQSVERKADRRFQQKIAQYQAGSSLMQALGHTGAAGVSAKKGADQAQKEYGSQALQLQSSTISDLRNHQNDTYNQVSKVNQELVEINRCNAIRG